MVLKIIMLDFAGRRFKIGKVHDKKVVYVRCGNIGMVYICACARTKLITLAILPIINSYENL